VHIIVNLLFLSSRFKERNAPAEQPICKPDGTELVGRHPVRRAVELLLPKDAEHVYGNQPASDIRVRRGAELAHRELRPRVVDVDERAEAGKKGDNCWVPLVVLLRRDTDPGFVGIRGILRGGIQASDLYKEKESDTHPK
jgi:hypothetical protein